VLSLREVVENVDAMKANLQARNMTVDIDRLVELEERRRSLGRQIEELRRDLKQVSKSFAKSDDADAVRARSQELRVQEKELTEQHRVVSEELDELADWIPNWLDPRVPMGGEDDAEVVREVGVPTTYDFEVKSSHDLGMALGLVDIEGAVRAAGSRFYALRREGILLRYALVQLFLSKAETQGFELVSPPVLAKRETLRASGYLPFQGADNYAIVGEDLSLTGTSEQSILGMHLGESLDQLPKAFLGESMCFRTEAGSYGRDTAGIFRAHQFFKLEQFVFCAPDQSETWFQNCLENEEWILQQLDIPYRVISTAAGDLGAPARMKYDTEAWFPAQQRYRELTSNSNLGEFQSRRGRISAKVDNQKVVPHTISATAFTDRLILALLETHQRADGSVAIPVALKPWFDRTELTPR
jgi:seryl-tRNA synthetase